jgi:methylmalonyl-CoA/ethylmalonyl-CoA epimerase
VAQEQFSTRLDHVAIAVWELSKAAAFWGDVLQGQYRQGDADWRGFAFAQFAFPGGGRVEILAPGSDDTGFVVKFLRRFGEGLHHITFVVGDLREQVGRIRGAGHQVFGEDYANPHWMEAFVSPGLVGSRALVQLAQSDLTAEEQDRAWGGKALRSVLEAAAARPDLR